MKLLHLLHLIAFLILASCGGKKPSVKLEVTGSALQASNIGYEGGVVIMGTGPNGSFTAPISYNASGTDSSVTIELPKGNWKFSAIGWNGTSEFTGTTNCDSTSVELKDDEQTVALSLSNTKCETMESEFGDNSYFNSSQFRAFTLATCGWLNENLSTPVSTTTLGTFCTTGNDPEYRVHAKSARVSVKQVIFGRVSEGLSACIPLVNGYLVSPLSLPTKGLPLEVELFKTNNCQEYSGEESIARYVFPRGLAIAVPDQDSFLNLSSGNTNLFLTANQTRRGYSSLLSAQPSFQCSGGNCMSLPSVIPSAGERIIGPNRDFVINDNPTTTQDCSTITTVASNNITATPPVQTQIINNCYRTPDGKLASRINYSSMTSGSIRLTYADTSQGPDIDLREDQTYNLFTRGFETFGYPLASPPSNDVRSSFEIFFQGEEKKFGILSNIREMLGPGGPAGLLGNIACTTNKTVEGAFEKDGEREEFRVQLATGTNTVTANIADGVKMAGDPLPRKLVLRKKIGSGNYSTVMIINFDCGYKIGTMEMFEDEGERVEKKRLEWNTQASGSQLAFEWKMETETVSGVIEKVRTSHTKIQNVSAQDTWSVTSSLEIKKNGANYDYRAFKDMIYAKHSSMRLKYVFADGVANGRTGTNDPTFATPLATNIIAAQIDPNPNMFCATLGATSFAVNNDTACTATPSTYQYTTFTDSELLPSTFDGLFTPGFSSLQ